MDFWNAQFSQVQIAEAAGTSVEKMRVWYNRGHLTWAEQDERSQKGLAHKLSARTALRVAIVNALADLWVPPAIGNKAAMVFLDLGELDQVTGNQREPGELFAEPHTVLAIYRDGSPMVHHVPLMKSTKGALFNAMRSYGGQEEGAVIILLDKLFKKVTTTLQDIERGQNG